MSVSTSKTSNTADRESRYRAHFYRIANLYCGPNRAHERKWKGAGRIDVSGIEALARLKAWNGEPLQYSMRATWASGFATFEDRVLATRSPMLEGCLQRQQAA